MPPKPIVIDLSHYQVIPESLEAAKAAGIVGVIHKATENTSYVDPKAASRFHLAREAGMLWGIYHFLRPKNIDKQADFFLSQKNLIDDDTLLVCDFEVAGIELNDVLHFLERVEKKSGQKPVLYSGNTLKELGGALKHPALAEYRLWIAQYNNKGPVLPKAYDGWWLWQFSETGKVPGITGTVDVNAYQGTARELTQDWVVRTISAETLSVSTANDPLKPTEELPVPSNEVPPIPKERVAVVKAAPPKWYAGLGAKLTAVVTGNGLVQWVTDKLATIQDLGIPSQVWWVIGIIVGAASIIWIADQIWDNRQKATTQKEIDDLLVKENSTTNNLVQLIPADEVDLYRLKGFKIITRGDKLPS